MSQTQFQNSQTFLWKYSNSIQEIDLCKPDILESQNLPQLTKINSEISMIQSFKNFDDYEKIDKIYEQIPLIETLKYKKQSSTQQPTNLPQTINKQNSLQSKENTKVQKTKADFLSEEEQEDKLNQETQKNENQSEQKISVQVTQQMRLALKEYWKDKNHKMNEIFKIKEKKENLYFGFYDYSSKKL